MNYSVVSMSDITNAKETLLVENSFLVPFLSDSAHLITIALVRFMSTGVAICWSHISEVK
jgi:hypothetical protein